MGWVKSFGEKCGPGGVLADYWSEVSLTSSSPAGFSCDGEGSVSSRRV